ncbi:putative agglutinin-like protein 5 [Apostichopus japonicus]|uniref:Putative agglutinin-like protein 5 n=1 Tax=Stichopus japonicus TaxID=307972 RepID=A0A2G8JXZ3_STIJA|nr:putative agglutinin-like protein 5 [Apostichopus japonicus]
MRCDSSYGVCPNDIDTDAMLQEGTTARVDFVASCDDNIDTGIQAACNATSQSEFPVGVTTVTCSCEDLSQNTDGCSFTVTVKGIQAACNATSQSEFPVGVTTVTCSCEDLSQNTDGCSFTVTVKGIQAACNATSQSEFPVGVTTVTCSCEDLSQNTDGCSFTVTVKDVTHPTAFCPNDIDTDAMLQEGTTARVDFVASCDDNIDTGIQAACNATSQSEFPVGVTTVTCSCEDLSQNTDGCSFTVTVKDVTHPTAFCPNDIDTDAMLQEGTTARVDFVASCDDNIDTGIQAACNATSQSEFPIVDFCDSDNKSDVRSLHNQDANNRHNKMCNKLSSWEIMRRHTDFANGSRQANDTIPRFTILLPRRKAIFMEDSNTCINDSNNTLDVKQRNECYLLRSTISVTTSQKIHVFHNSTSYCLYDHRREAMGECFDYTSVDMNNDVLVFESGLSMYKNSLTSNVSSSKPILIAKEIEEGWQHEYKSTAEYITSINYDDVENNTRVEVNEFTITADTHYPWPLQLDRLLGNGKILCRIQWDSGNISIPDCEHEECFISDKLIEIRYEKFDVTNNVTIRNTDIFSITVRVELFFISAVNNALPPVVVKPFIKKCFTGSGWKIYASVTYLSKPVYNLSVNATIRGPDGASHELLLSDIPEESDDMMDGIYSNVIDVNGSGCYSVQVTVKGTNNITWNMENLQPSGVVPSECDVPLNPLNAALENADSLMRMPKELNFYVTDVTPPMASCQENIITDASLQGGTTASVDLVTSCSDNIDTGIQAACNATSQSEFPVGVTKVTCSCEDLSKNTDECSFTVTVKDVTHPNASCPNDIDTDARLQEGTTARVDFVTSCSDNIDTGIQAACNATSESEFPVGVTTVTCSCEDLSQNTDECSFTVTVKGIQAACDATSESEFPVGVTTVTCSCEDLSQNTDECSFTVTVKDVTHPNASCPNDIDTDARLQEGTTARVDFVTSCSDNIDTGIQAACNATSESEFPVGVTTVTCSCEDLSQNTDECSFTVTVKDVAHPNASCPNDIDTDARLQEGTTARVDFVTSCSDNIDTGIQALVMQPAKVNFHGPPAARQLHHWRSTGGESRRNARDLAGFNPAVRRRLRQKTAGETPAYRRLLPPKKRQRSAGVPPVFHRRPLKKRQRTAVYRQRNASVPPVYRQCSTGRPEETPAYRRCSTSRRKETPAYRRRNASVPRCTVSVPPADRRRNASVPPVYYQQTAGETKLTTGVPLNFCQREPLAIH